jgi:translation initiation factor 1
MDDWRAQLLRQSGYSEDELAQAGREREDAERAKAGAKAEKTGEKLSVFVEKKGRAGKTATIITGFRCDDDRLKAVAAKLKAALGCGGSARAGEILIQGERRADVEKQLRAMGYKI